MQLGMIGLGRMGANIVRRLMRDGHECVVYDVNADAIAELEGEGATGARSLEEIGAEAPRRRGRSWIMVPAAYAGATAEDDRAAPRGRATRSSTAATRTTTTTSPGRRRSPSAGIHYLDVGTSGGVFGLERGYCMMIGGDTEAVQRLDPIFRTLAPGVEAAERTPGRTGDPVQPEMGYLHCGPARRRPLREDGPQRDRVRDHGRLRRGPGDPARRRTSATASRCTTPRRPRCATRRCTGTTSTRPPSPRCGAAARSSRRGCST